MRLFLIIAAFINLSLAAEADESILWGPPVNGLRIGILQPDPLILSTVSQPKFTLFIENVSQSPIILPNRDSFLDRPSVDDGYHSTPLEPIFADPAAVAGGWGSDHRAYSDFKPSNLTLAPREKVTWNDIPIEHHYYDETTPKEQSMEKNYGISAPNTYQLHFQYANEQKQVGSVAVWTGAMNTGTINLVLKKPSSEGIHLEGGFDLPKSIYFYGEPIWVTYHVTNKGTFPVCFVLGVSERFDLQAADEGGKAVKFQENNEAMDGPIFGRALKPGETYHRRILANLQCPFVGPGKYVITCQRTFDAGLVSKSSANALIDNSISSDVHIESTLHLEIQPDRVALDAYLNKLVPLTLTPTPTPEPQTPSSDGNFDLQDPAEDRRDEIRALCLANNAAAFPALVRYLDVTIAAYKVTDTPRSVESTEDQWQLVQALCNYRGETAAPVLIDRLFKLEPISQSEVLNQLGRWKTPHLEGVLVQALASANNSVRSYAANTIGMLQLKSLLPELAKLQFDPDKSVRNSTVEALRLLNDPITVPLLVIFLHDKEPDVQVWAATTLVGMKRTECVPVLMKLLNDDDYQRRAGDSSVFIPGDLQQATGETFQRRSEWNAWWEKTGKAKYPEN